MNLNKLETHKCITISGQGNYMYIWQYNRIAHECIPRGSTPDSSDRDDRVGPKIPCRISEP